MNFDDWNTDLAAGSATNSSGFTLRIEGNPRDPSEVFPGKFPDAMSFVDQARLLRSGLDALAKAAKQGGVSEYVMPKPQLKSAAAQEREALAKQFAERADKPQRSVLSLKKGG